MTNLDTAVLITVAELLLETYERAVERQDTALAEHVRSAHTQVHCALAKLRTEIGR